MKGSESAFEFWEALLMQLHRLHSESPDRVPAAENARVQIPELQITAFGFGTDLTRLLHISVANMTGNLSQQCFSIDSAMYIVINYSLHGYRKSEDRNHYQRVHPYSALLKETANLLHL
jgi:hypothetical protein